MRENVIERKLVQAVTKLGGLCLKVNTTSLDGMPDRLIFLSGGRVAWVEVKATGEKPRKLQVRRIGQLRALGQKVFVLDDVGKISEVLDGI